MFSCRRLVTLDHKSDPFRVHFYIWRKEKAQVLFFCMDVQFLVPFVKKTIFLH